MSTTISLITIGASGNYASNDEINNKHPQSILSPATYVERATKTQHHAVILVFYVNNYY